MKRPGARVVRRSAAPSSTLDSRLFPLRRRLVAGVLDGGHDRVHVDVALDGRGARLVVGARGLDARQLAERVGHVVLAAGTRHAVDVYRRHARP